MNERMNVMQTNLIRLSITKYVQYGNGNQSEMTLLLLKLLSARNDWMENMARLSRILHVIFVSLNGWARARTLFSRLYKFAGFAHIRNI